MFTLGAIGALAGAAAAVAVAATPGGHVASSTPPCIPKYSSAGGHTTVNYCGPATATLKIGSKTYSFKNGYCRTHLKDKIALAFTLGTLKSTRSPINGGQPLFEFTDLNIGAGLSLATVNADYHGKMLDSVGTVSLKGSIPAGGTFTSKGFAKPKFTGSWNCHHVVYAQS